MSNPIFNSINNQEAQEFYMSANPVTVSGVINKSLILFALVLAGCFIQWELILKNYSGLFSLLTIGGSFGYFICALVGSFVPQTRNLLLPLGAFLEGFAVGGISIFLNRAYPGIVTQAILSTFCVFFIMLVLYQTKIIKATEKFMAVISISTLSVLVIYLLHFILSFFNLGLVSLFSSSNIGIGFSIFVIIVAALNFVMDFTYIEKAQNLMVDKSYELYLAFGLMATFIWVYMEILRLLAKLNPRR